MVSDAAEIMLVPLSSVLQGVPDPQGESRCDDGVDGGHDQHQQARRPGSFQDVEDDPEVLYA